MNDSFILVFEEISILFSVVAVSINITTNSEKFRIGNSCTPVVGCVSLRFLLAVQFSRSVVSDSATP